MPPEQDVIISGGEPQSRPREGRGPHMPIDRFFHSLAEDHKDRAIGIVLSGTASDGSRGSKPSGRKTASPSLRTRPRRSSGACLTTPRPGLGFHPFARGDRQGARPDRQASLPDLKGAAAGSRPAARWRLPAGKSWEPYSDGSGPRRASIFRSIQAGHAETADPAAHGAPPNIVASGAYLNYLEESQ